MGKKKFLRKTKKKLFKGGSINPFLGVSINSNNASLHDEITQIMKKFAKFETNAQWIKIFADYKKEIMVLSGLFSLCVVGYIVKQKIDNNKLSKKLTKSKKNIKTYKKALKKSQKAIMQIKKEHDELTELYKFNTAINTNITPYINSLYGILNPLRNQNINDDCKLTTEQKINNCVCYKN